MATTEPGTLWVPEWFIPALAYGFTGALALSVLAFGVMTGAQALRAHREWWRRQDEKERGE